jgi:phosphoserine aminotransferase
VADVDYAAGHERRCAACEQRHGGGEILDTAERRCERQPAIAIAAPASASVRAKSRRSPLDAPATSATLPSRRRAIRIVLLEKRQPTAAAIGRVSCAAAIIVRRPGIAQSNTITVSPRPRRNPTMRIFNFSAGPAVLPEPVLRQAAAEMLDWHGSGMSVMEMSHRGKEFISIAEKVEADLRSLLTVPANYKVLFLQGGAIGENAIVPMNLLAGRSVADFVNTGEWSKKTIKEAKKYCTVNIAASSEDQHFTYVPARETWKLSENAAYVHVCTNETIGGVEYQWTPDTGDIPLVADMSSHIMSRVIDVSKFGVIYGGAQKNVGPAGLTLVIVRDDLLDRALPLTPSAFNWKEQAAADSMLNTPPTYAIYIAGLVFEWLQREGGVAAIEKRNIAKARLLYDYLDRTQFYRSPVRKQDRSRMNVPFKLHDESLDEPFLKGAKERGMVQLKGHRSVGGMRASIYNAMPIEGVQTLVDYMQEFERRRG